MRKCTHHSEPPRLRFNVSYCIRVAPTNVPRVFAYIWTYADSICLASECVTFDNDSRPSTASFTLLTTPASDFCWSSGPAEEPAENSGGGRRLVKYHVSAVDLLSSADFKSRRAHRLRGRPPPLARNGGAGGIDPARSRRCSALRRRFVRQAARHQGLLDQIALSLKLRKDLRYVHSGRL